MDRKHFSMMVATVFITMMITVSIQLQISNIQGLSDISTAGKSFTGQKIAGSFHLLTKDGDIGKVSSFSTTEVEDGYCVTSHPGFSSDERLMIWTSESSSCNYISESLSVIYYSGSYETLAVGAGS